MLDNSLPPNDDAKRSPPGRSPSELRSKSTRRRFTNEYKLRILEELDACTKPGEITALLRREGLYSSYLPEWRQQRERGLLGPKPDAALAEQLARVERENRRLQEKLRQAELILDIQEKTSEILGIRLKAARLDTDD